jgi:hypothetical protein
MSGVPVSPRHPPKIGPSLRIAVLSGGPVRLKLPNGRNAYWLTEQPYPPAGYVPGVMSDSAADQPEAEPELPQISNDL